MAEKAWDGFPGVMGADFSVLPPGPGEPTIPESVCALYLLPESRGVIYYQGTVKGRLALPRGDA